MDGQTDRQMDVGHINLIGGLVTRNPPKNLKLMQTSSRVPKSKKGDSLTTRKHSDREFWVFEACQIYAIGTRKLFLSDQDLHITGEISRKHFT